MAVLHASGLDLFFAYIPYFSGDDVDWLWCSCSCFFCDSYMGEESSVLLRSQFLTPQFNTNGEPLVILICLVQKSFLHNGTTPYYRLFRRRGIGICLGTTHLRSMVLINLWTLLNFVTLTYLWLSLNAIATETFSTRLVVRPLIFLLVFICIDYDQLWEGWSTAGPSFLTSFADWIRLGVWGVLWLSDIPVVYPTWGTWCEFGDQAWAYWCVGVKCKVERCRDTCKDGASTQARAGCKDGWRRIVANFHDYLGTWTAVASSWYDLVQCWCYIPVRWVSSSRILCI